MSLADKKAFYRAPTKSLQQGDVFRINIVGPATDEVPRIFRAKDGRHGSAVFADGCLAKVFTLDGIGELLRALSDRTELHTPPFQTTTDGEPEMVVVYARLLKYFIIASHTCDISGADHPPMSWTTILPVVTIAETCRTQRMPLPEHGEDTIEGFLLTHLEGAAVLPGADELTYGDTVRDVVSRWGEKGVPKALKQARGLIRRYLNKPDEKAILHHLPHSEKHSMPESCVDFSAAFTVPTATLVRIRDHRVATIARGYRDEFSQAYGGLFARATTPAPVKPPRV